MLESPASSQLPAGKRGEGPVTPSAAATSGLKSESGAREKDRGEGVKGRANGDDLTDLSYRTGISGAGSVPLAASCEVGRSGVHIVPGSTSSGSGGYIQKSEDSGEPSFPSRGMDVNRLQQQLIDYTDSLFAEGLLDDQFTQLQLLQDVNNPEFVSEVVSLFFEDSEKLLDQLTELIDADPIDYKKVDAHVHQFKGSSSSIGAQRIKAACITFRTCCEEESREGCRRSLALVKQEFFLVKSKLEAMLRMEQQLLAAGGTLPFME